MSASASSTTKVSKRQLLELVWESLVIDGHRGAAEAFGHETGLTSSAGASDDVDSTAKNAQLTHRVDVRERILASDSAAAMRILGQHYGPLLASDRAIAFRLQQQAVVDSLSKGHMPAAMEEAARLATGDWPPTYQQQLETTAAALLFDASNAECMPPHVAALLSQQHRLESAEAVNRALLVAQGGATHSRLPGVLQASLGLGAAAHTSPAATVGGTGAGTRSSGSAAAVDAADVRLFTGGLPLEG